jgi:hypothetical protein
VEDNGRYMAQRFRTRAISFYLRPGASAHETSSLVIAVIQKREHPPVRSPILLRFASQDSLVPQLAVFIYGVLALSSAFIIVKSDRKTNAAFVYEAHEHTKMRRKSFDDGIVARPLCTFCTFVDRIIKRLLRGVQFSLEPPQHH